VQRGNAALLQTDNTRVLVDAGFSAKRLAERLEELGEKLANIDAIFLTHEHGDHAAGLTGLARTPTSRFSPPRDAEALQAGLKYRRGLEPLRDRRHFPFPRPGGEQLWVRMMPRNPWVPHRPRRRRSPFARCSLPG